MSRTIRTAKRLVSPLAVATLFMAPCILIDAPFDSNAASIDAIIVGAYAWAVHHVATKRALKKAAEEQKGKT